MFKRKVVPMKVKSNALEIHKTLYNSTTDMKNFRHKHTVRIKVSYRLDPVQACRGS